MDLTPYVNDFGQRFSAAAAASGPEASEVAGRLSAALDSAVRLLLLGVLSAATVEISRDLAPGSVEIRLRGLDPEFAVTLPAREQDVAVRPAGDTGPAFPAAAEPESDDGGIWRINLRLPAQLKPRIEDAASRDGVSVNSWLSRAATAALGGERAGQASRDERDGRRGGLGGLANPGGQRYTGWVR